MMKNERQAMVLRLDDDDIGGDRGGGNDVQCLISRS